MIKIANSSNITIRNCFFNKGVAEAINIYMGTNVRIENCLFNAVTTGVNASTSTGVKVLNNQFVNVKGPMPKGQFVQFNAVTGAGNEIIGNKGENFQGESDPADLISIFNSSGTAASPILIKNNMFRGGGPLASGGGIALGDFGSSYTTADGNVLLNPGQYGMAIAGGSNNIIINNKIFSQQFPWSNIALFIWPQEGSTVCANNIIKGNRATWINKDGVLNVGWNGANFNGGNCTGTIWESPTPITEAELNIPIHLIDFVSPEELLKIRGK
jgi:parallel beta-helix repeat protein